MNSVRTIPLHDEARSIGFDRWTKRHADLLALLMTPERNRFLLPVQREEVRRLCRFKIGDRVRAETLGWLNRTYDNVRGHIRDAREQQN